MHTFSRRVSDHKTVNVLLQSIECILINNQFHSTIKDILLCSNNNRLNIPHLRLKVTRNNISNRLPIIIT